MRDVVIHVCRTCRREGEPAEGVRAGARLLERMLALDPPIRVEGVDCLANCRRACSVAFSAPGAWGYVFGDLDPGRDAEAILAAALAYGHDADGLVPWRARSDALKRGIIARIPPLATIKDAAE